METTLLLKPAEVAAQLRISRAKTYRIDRRERHSLCEGRRQRSGTWRSLTGVDCRESGVIGRGRGRRSVMCARCCSFDVRATPLTVLAAQQVE